LVSSPPPKTSISWSAINHGMLCGIAIYLHPSSLNRLLSFEDFEIALNISMMKICSKLAGVEFIDENGGEPAMRLRKRQQRKKEDREISERGGLSAKAADATAKEKDL
jgi:hypothetical protein